MLLQRSNVFSLQVSEYDQDFGGSNYLKHIGFKEAEYDNKPVLGYEAVYFPAAYEFKGVQFAGIVDNESIFTMAGMQDVQLLPIKLYS